MGNTLKYCPRVHTFMSVMQFFLTLMPWYMCPSTWAFRSSVTRLMGFRPAFSASVYGTTCREEEKEKEEGDE